MRIFSTSAMTKIFEQAPEEKSRFYSVEGDFTTFQVVIDQIGEDAIFGAKIELVGAKGEVFRVNSIANDMPYRGKSDDGYLSKEKGLYPDPLATLSAAGEILHPDRPNVFYVKVKTPSEGDLICSVRATVGEEHLIASVTVHVRKVSEIQDNHIYSDWVHFDAIAREHRVQLFDDAFYRVFESYLALATESGVNMLMIPAFTPELDTYVGGDRTTAQLVDVAHNKKGYQFFFDRLEKFLQFVETRGVKYFEFPPLFSQWSAANAVKFEVTEKKGKSLRFGWATKSDDAEYLDFLSEFMTALGDFLKRTGRLEHSYFHMSDELEHAEKFSALAQLMQEKLHGAHFFDTVSSAENPREGFEDIVALQSADDGREKGFPVSAVYYCWEQRYNFLSNRFLSMSLSRTAIIGAQMVGAKANLLLHWGFNFYNSALSYFPIDPYANASCAGIFPAGDSFIVYPDRENGRALPSVRLYAMHRAFLAYRLLSVMEQENGRAAVEAFLKKEKISGYSEYPRAHDFYEGFEERLILAASKASV